MHQEANDTASNEGIHERMVALVTSLKKRGINLGKIAKVMGIQRQTLYTRLSGDKDWRSSEIDALADFLKTPVDVMLAGELRDTERMLDYLIQHWNDKERELVQSAIKRAFHSLIERQEAPDWYLKSSR